MAPPRRLDDGPDIGYRFLTLNPPQQASRTRRAFSSLTASLTVHALVITLVAIAIARAPVARPSSTSSRVSPRLVWNASQGRSGGGRDGSKDAKPAGRVQLVGRESVTLPTVRPVTLNPVTPQPAPEPAPRLTIPEPTVSSGLVEMVGAVSELRPLDVNSRGPGTGDGTERGRGPGSGDGDGPGLGPGRGPGWGDDQGETPGNGVTWPRLVREVKPNYTADAMRAQVEGMVELEIVVLPDGSVGRVSIVRSLDNRFGLDQEAIDAVRRWRFDPGRRSGKAVPVRVGVELSFNLR
jgi:TonB family protein